MGLNAYADTVYPDDYDTFRTVDNLPNKSFSNTQEKTLFAEDIAKLNNAVAAIQTALGLDPNLSYDNVGDAIADAISIAGTASLKCPVGGVMAWTTETAPSGWKICDGTSLSRTTYSVLFTAIGTRFGYADSTHFNLPDYRGFALVGQETYGAFGSLNSTTGEEMHTITTTEMPTHNHPVGYVDAGACAPTYHPDGSWGTVLHHIGGGTPFNSYSDNSGGGAAMPIVQPSAVIKWIMRVN